MGEKQQLQKHKKYLKLLMEMTISLIYISLNGLNIRTGTWEPCSWFKEWTATTYSKSRKSC